MSDTTVNSASQAPQIKPHRKVTKEEEKEIFDELFEYYHNQDYPQLRRATAKKFGLSKEGLDNAILSGLRDFEEYENDVDEMSPAKYRKKLKWYIQRSTYYYANQGLAFSVTKHFNNIDLPEEDRFEAAQAGFVTALETFDETKGVQFSTYAWRVMFNEIIGANKKYQRPKLVKQKARVIFAKEDGFIYDITESQNSRKVLFKGEKIHPKDVVVEINDGMSEKIYPYLYDLSEDIKPGALIKKGQRLGMTAGVETDVASVESIVESDEHGDTNFINPMKFGRREENADDNLEKESIIAEIYEAINHLPKIEQIIITKRFLGNKKENRKQVAKEVQLSEYRVQKYEKHALSKLKEELSASSIYADALNN